jgi:hypothetical protein
MTNQTAKKQVAVRLELRKKAKLEREAAERGVSRSEYIREILDNRHRADELADELERKRDRIEELESQLRKRSNIEDKIEDLPDKIRGADSYSERRQRMLDQASLGQRLRWKLTGVPVEELDD